MERGHRRRAREERRTFFGPENRDPNGNTGKYLGDANITPLTPKSMNRYLLATLLPHPSRSHAIRLFVCVPAAPDER